MTDTWFVSVIDLSIHVQIENYQRIIYRNVDQSDCFVSGMRREIVIWSEISSKQYYHTTIYFLYVFRKDITLLFMLSRRLHGVQKCVKYLDQNFIRTK